MRLDLPKILIYLSSPALVIGLFLWGISTCSREDSERSSEVGEVRETTSISLDRRGTNHDEMSCKSGEARREKSLRDGKSGSGRRNPSILVFQAAKLQ